MRTVSFSSAPVRQTLKKHFVASYINTEGDASAGNSQAHGPTDSPGRCARGVGRQNVQCLFMTPGGRIFHTASGFRSAPDLLKELQFASGLFDAIRKSPKTASNVVAHEHKQRLLKQGFTEEEIRTPANSPFALMNSIRKINTGRKGQAMPTSVDEFFAGKTRQAELADGQFMMKSPLTSMTSFLKNPRQLTGNESSSFSSSGNGGASGGRIGN